MVEYWPSERISGGVFSEILPGYSLWRNDCSPHRLARNLKNFYYLSSQGETANTLSTARTIRNTIISVAAVSTMALPLFASASVSNNAGGAVNVVYNTRCAAASWGQRESMQIFRQRRSGRGDRTDARWLIGPGHPVARPMQNPGHR